MKLSKPYIIERCQTEKLALKSVTIEIKLHQKWKTANLSKQKRKSVNLNIGQLKLFKKFKEQKKKKKLNRC